MNFVDTAITLLHESGRPMGVEELCNLALDRGLLDKPGANPLRSMKTRLTVELKKGRSSRVRRDDDEEVWTLKKGVKLPEGAPFADDAKAAKKAPAKKAAKKPAAKKAATKKTATKKTSEAKEVAPKKAAAKKAAPKKSAAKKAADEAEVKEAAPKKSAAKKSTAKKAAPKKAAAAKKAEKPAKSADAAPEKAVPAKAKPANEADAQEEPAPKKKRRSRKGKEEVAAPAQDEGQQDLPLDAKGAEPEVALEEPVKLTPEEEELAKLYASDSEGTRSAAELNEYRDELTKDEDRPMLPEIRAERRPMRGRERGRKRRTREGKESRSERSRSRRSERTERPERKRSAAPSGPRDIAGTPIAVVDADASAPEQLTGAAHAILAALPAGQSMPVRQLTQALIRQGHLEGRADGLWRMVKGTLLVSEQRRDARGLQPLICYRGKDLFAAAEVRGRSAVDLAEAALAKAAENYAAAALAEMQSRLSQLAPQMLERIAYVYLQSTGWTDISWIKRVEKSSYALATAPGAVDQTLIAVRSGPEAIDRRGVGELRAGVYAKDLDSGFLISPVELSEEADQELAKEGTHVRVLCGSDFVDELSAREVGLTWKHLRLPKIDQRFWDALLS